jgi:hypothetical protein
MSKFGAKGSKPRVRGPVTTVGTTTTYEGGHAFKRDTLSELALMAATNMVGEKKFYASAQAEDSRYKQLVREVATSDYPYVAEFFRWLRTEANMRDASAMGACEAVRARLKAGIHGGNRQIIRAAIDRADEPKAILGYWTENFGFPIPTCVDRGVSDAIWDQWTEYSALKYDTKTAAGAWRFGRILDLVRPTGSLTDTKSKPIKDTWRADLYRYLVCDFHGKPLPSLDRLPMIEARRELMALPVPERRAVLRRPDAADRLRAAGITWEALSGWLQSAMDAEAWDAVIPSMGIFALTRNLRNFAEAGISSASMDLVAAKLADPGTIARSKMFPYRFLSAYLENQSYGRWSYPLERALTLASRNIPALPGPTLVLVDTSSSMTSHVSEKSHVQHVHVGALIGTALAARGQEVDLHGFAGGTGRRVTFKHNLVKNGDVLPQTRDFIKRIGEVGHGTETYKAVQETFRHGYHRRVVIVTDSQAFPDYRGPVTEAVPGDVQMFGVDTTGYSASMIDTSKPNRFEIGGFSDSLFKMMALLANGKDARWPWEEEKDRVTAEK